MEGSSKRPERRLAAILAADVAGYSRLMSQDEVRTLQALAAHREVMDRLIAEHGGRIANTAGDSVLAEFPSAVDAVQCAVEVQRALGELNAGADPETALRFRIGIHVGDVMVRSGDLLGDGVNIAARLESLAEAGGVCLSGDAHRQVRKALSLDFKDLGLQQVKNIDEPVRAFAVQVIAQPEAVVRRVADTPKPLPLPEKPSIAVLPFTNMSGDTEQEYFADGVVEDIITALSHFSRLFVIARNSSFTYKGRAVDVRQVGQELGVRYVLEGSVRRAGDRLRLTGQLIDTQEGTHLWAERFDGSTHDIFALQDELTAKVVGAIVPRLEAAEIERARRTRPDRLDAYDIYLRAVSALRQMTLRGTDEALSLVARALEIDPGYAVAAGLGAWVTTIRVAQSWPLDRAQEKTRGIELGRIAVSQGRDDAEALAGGGYALAFLGGELQEGLRAIKRALALNPNDAVAFVHAGWVHNYSGQPAEAIDAIEQAIRLSPRDPMLCRAFAVRSVAHLFRHELEDAIAWGVKGVEDNPNYNVTYRALASAYAHAGRLSEARQMLQRLDALVPGLTLRTLPEWDVFRHSGGLEYMVEGLRRAGIPE